VRRRPTVLLIGLALASLTLPLDVLAVDDYGSEATTSPAPSSTAGPTPMIAAIPLERVEDELFGIASVVPESWQPQGQGIHARGTPPGDPTLIALQAVPAASDALWDLLVPQLALTERPEPVGERRTEHLDWTLYAFESGALGIDLDIDLAVAEEEGRTYVVLLQSPAGEGESLHESVFLPAVDAYERLEPKPTPDPATLGYAVQEVTFPGGSEDVELAGTLTLPEGEGPHPVVVLMSGSGPQDRDESIAGARIKPFALIADALTSAGVGVLRYDDRGFAGSTGDHEAATVEDLTGDGRAALDYLSTRADVDQDRLGVLGHSEGAIYAATLAPEDPRVAFAVVLAPPALDGVSLLIAQNEAVVRSSGEPPVEIAASVEFAEAAYPAAREGDAAAVEEAIRTSFGALWDRQDDDARAMLGERDVYVGRQVDLLLPTLMSAWFRSLLATDPAADWSQVRVPVLALFGERDVQVPVDANEAALVDALEQAGNDDVTIVTIPDANHLFQEAETGALAEYGTLPDTFQEDVLPTLVDWTTERVGVGRGAPSPAP
jgi:uncharacterized protein